MTEIELELDRTRRKLEACTNQKTDLVFQLMTATQMKESLKLSLTECVNELCLRCKAYLEEHNGACDGCRWKAVRHGDFDDAGSD